MAIHLAGVFVRPNWDEKIKPSSEKSSQQSELPSWVPQRLKLTRKQHSEVLHLVKRDTRGKKRFKCWLSLVYKYGFKNLLNNFKITMITIKVDYRPYQTTGEEKAKTKLTIKIRVPRREQNKNSKQHKLRPNILVMKKYKWSKSLSYVV